MHNVALVRHRKGSPARRSNPGRRRCCPGGDPGDPEVRPLILDGRRPLSRVLSVRRGIAHKACSRAAATKSEDDPRRLRWRGAFYGTPLHLTLSHVDGTGLYRERLDCPAPAAARRPGPSTPRASARHRGPPTPSSARPVTPQLLRCGRSSLMCGGRYRVQFRCGGALRAIRVVRRPRGVPRLAGQRGHACSDRRGRHERRDLRRCALVRVGTSDTKTRRGRAGQR